MPIAVTRQKLRGGYYTPKPIAEFLARWAVQRPGADVLEPSCGDGELLEAAAHVLLDLGIEPASVARSIHGIELDGDEAGKARNRLCRFGLPEAEQCVVNQDFFTYCKAHLFGEHLFNTPLAERKAFDAVIGNPPFIRYQDFPEAHRRVAFDLMKQAGFKPNRLTNIWVPFLVISAHLLKKNGRLAMVIPAELLQVNYAAETRLFLSNFFESVTLISFKKLVFSGIQQEIMLLLGERDGAAHHGIRVVELHDARQLNAYKHGDLASIPLKPLDHSKEKWTQYFLTHDEILCLRRLAKHPKVTRSGSVIDVDVGVVTGNNKFFVLDQEQALEQSVDAYTRSIVTRSAQLEGALFTKTDGSAKARLLFNPPNVSVKALPEPVQAFIAAGETDGVHQGYKCRIRKRWYIVPSIWTPDAFMLRQVHRYPKLVLNEVNATCTDTIHRVRFINGRAKEQVVASFMNSLTFAIAEIKGRSYGGGVLTFEPSEAEDLPLPLEGAEKLDLGEIDALLRAQGIEAVLDRTDQVLLVEGMGLSQAEVREVRGIWEKLRDRRINRR